MKILKSILLVILIYLLVSCGNTEVYKDKPAITFKKTKGYFYSTDTVLNIGKRIKVGLFIDAQGVGNLIMNFKIEKIIYIDSLITILDTIPKQQNLNIDFFITQNEIDTTIWVISAMDKSNNLSEVSIITYLNHN